MNVLVVLGIIAVGLVLFVPPRWLLVGVVLSLALALLIRFHTQILPALKATWAWLSDRIRGRAPSAPRPVEPPAPPPERNPEP